MAPTIAVLCPRFTIISTLTSSLVSHSVKHRLETKGSHCLQLRFLFEPRLWWALEPNGSGKAQTGNWWASSLDITWQYQWQSLPQHVLMIGADRRAGIYPEQDLPEKCSVSSGECQCRANSSEGVPHSGAHLHITTAELLSSQKSELLFATTWS